GQTPPPLEAGGAGESSATVAPGGTTAAGTQGGAAPEGTASGEGAGPAAEGATVVAAPAAQVPATVPAKNEAPMLAEQVQAGTLPPLAERVPKEPMAVPVVEKVGQYGGEWTSGILGGSDNAWLLRTAFYDNLVRWDTQWKDVIPDVAASWEVSDDGTTYTFKLREGMKWSDGKPFTSADILFYVQDIYGNEELSPGGQPGWLRAGGEQAEVTAPDPTTIVFKFPVPYGLFLQRLATPDARPLVDAQAEYAKQFHIKYNPQANDLAKQSNFPTWVELFQNKVTSGPGGVNARNQNVDLPTISAWRVTNAINQGNRMVLERNPYYWKVDPEGNQLPYIDRMVYPLIENREVLTLNALNGQVDMMDRHISTLANKAVFTDNQEQGNYRFFETVPDAMNTTVIALNLTHKDETKREIFNNKLFRQALSVAINRQEIIDLVYIAQGKPFQAAPRPESEFYDEEMATQFTEFDPEQAKQFLREAGLKEAGGKWQTAAGQPFAFSIEVATGVADVTDVMELVVGYWQAIGLEVNLVTEERALFYTRKENNEHDANVWGGDGGLAVVLEPRWYFPYSGESNFAMAWQYWFNNPQDERGQEPPAEVKKQMDLYNQLKAEPDPAKQSELMKQILQITKEQFYVIGVTLPPNGYGIVKNDFHNVPATMFNAYLWPHPGPTNPQQYYKGN
ncbi:MAG TPA: ABC transporter substrate-binding protein, partial [Herpetosiphonaceae bacterium]|nr:ABC transporter substrate-binding protein [Herpetosiphonaceae bacterium]